MKCGAHAARAHIHTHAALHTYTHILCVCVCVCAGEARHGGGAHTPRRSRCGLHIYAYTHRYRLLHEYAIHTYCNVMWILLPAHESHARAYNNNNNNIHFDDHSFLNLYVVVNDAHHTHSTVAARTHHTHTHTYIYIYIHTYIHTYTCDRMRARCVHQCVSVGVAPLSLSVQRGGCGDMYFFYHHHGYWSLTSCVV